MRSVCSLVLLLSIMLGNSIGQQIRDEDLRMVAKAREQVRKFHAGAEEFENRVHVVYFHARDQEPLKAYLVRLKRILADVELFFSQQLGRYGIEDQSIRFARDKYDFAIHVVRGRLPSQGYKHNSGNATFAEIRAALGDEIDFEKSHVLIIHGLCDQLEDGRYFFHAPYYGRGDQQNGVCHAADCELLDPRRLVEKDQKIVFREHYYERMEMTVGKFNSWYLGGIAHELGHGIGLPHDSGSPKDRKAPGYALMGGGNLHYRENLWGGKRPSYLCTGTVLRLLSSPLMTGSNRGRFEKATDEFRELKFRQQDDMLEVRGKTNADATVYSVVGYVWHPREWPGNPQNDHRSLSYPALVEGDEFQVSLADLPAGTSRFRLTTLFCSGAFLSKDFQLEVSQDGSMNVADLNARWQLAGLERKLQSGTLERKDFESVVLDDGVSDDVSGKLSVLRQVAERPQPIDLFKTDLKRVWLSDAKWDSASVGWGRLARNYFDLKRERRNSIYLELEGQVYSKGLYAHSESTFVFAIGMGWKRMKAKVGLRDGALDQGSAIFKVIGDGKELFRSELLRVGRSQDVEVDVTGIQRLELRAVGGEGHIHNSWAIWAEPQLER